MQIPFVDLKAQHDEIRGEIDQVIKEVIDSSSFVGGKIVENFEREFAEFSGSRFAIGCASGTDALKLGLMSTVGVGEIVITVPNTFVATVEAIIQVGAYPKFVDIDPHTYNLDPQAVKDYVETECDKQDGGLFDRESGRKVAAILPVHLYGLPVDMKPLWELADKYDLAIVEDACQAHGASYYNCKVGTFADTTAFSFYPGKNLGAMGDGGIVITSSPEKAESMRIWQDHGQKERYIYITPDGWNSRLDALQAGILSVKLKKLTEWNNHRREVAKWYREYLDDSRVILPIEPCYAYHVYHLFVVRIPERDRVREELSKRNIQTGLHYPVPLHKQPFDYLKQGPFPNTERVASEILSLPMYPHLTKTQVKYVCDNLLDVLK